MEYSKNYRQQLTDKIFDFRNTTKYEILHNNMESDSQSSNEDNCSSSDSRSDMNVDNTEEHKEQSISKQEQIDRKTFLQFFSQWSKYDNASQIYITRKLSLSERKPGPFLIITRYSENLLKTTEKVKAGLLERLRISMSNMFLVKLIITDHYQQKNFER